MSWRIETQTTWW